MVRKLSTDEEDIQTTKLALEDLIDMRERWTRVLNQLDLYYTRKGISGEIPNPQRWAMEQLEKITQSEDALNDHLKNLESK